jgi:dihydroorotase
MKMQAESIVLRGGRVVCPASQTDVLADVWIRDGKIAGLGDSASGVAGREIDCTGVIIAPGFTDLGAELCDPGICWREDLSSGSEAAAAGGFTTVVASPKTDPVVDNPVAVSEILGRAQGVSGARVEIAGALTLGLKGESLSELGLMVEAGAVAFSDGRIPMGNSGFLRRSLDYARPFGVPIFLRPGDTDIEGAGVMHEGEVSVQIGLRGIPAASEEVGVGRAIAMARLTGARIHLSHVTTEAALTLMRSAKAQALSVTCGVPARHLLLTDRLVDESVYDTATRLLPPLRSEADRAACVAAVLDGTIDCITADHVPMTPLEKEVEFMHAKPGAMGLETAFGAALTALRDVGATVRALAVGPAAVLGRRASIEVGVQADLVVFDPEAEAVVAGPFRSRGLNEPLVGRSIQGRIHLTICNGCIIYGPQPG